MEREEKREFKRWRVLVRCTVGWQNKEIRGRTLDLSYGGALITTQANFVPPKGALVTVRFDFVRDEGAVENILSSRIIHTIPKIAEEGRLGSFGVKFEEPILKVTNQLHPLSALSP